MFNSNGAGFEHKVKKKTTTGAANVSKIPAANGVFRDGRKCYFA